jgi:hypothetical protein
MHNLRLESLARVLLGPVYYEVILLIPQSTITAVPLILASTTPSPVTMPRYSFIRFPSMFGVVVMSMVGVLK